MNYNFQGLRILAVDDLYPNRLLIEKYFEKLGIAGDFAENGQEAIKMIRENQYDLVFMDIQMPVMDGLEAVRIIREDIDDKLPIIALSGSATEEQLVDSINYGMTDYYMKPISFDKIKEVIKKYAKNKTRNE